MKVLKIVLAFVLVILLIAAIIWFGFLKPKPPPISPEDRAQINMMPLPAELTLGGQHFLIDADFGSSFKNVSSTKLSRALDRFYTRLGAQTGIIFSKKGKQKLILDCKNISNEYPSLDDDEAYSLLISEQKIILSANAETGILYGLESLLQLVKIEDGHWVMPTLEIKDKPRYPWRGLMIDVARHWIPKEVILRNLDAMAMNKMNVFHWHLTEYQGFRIESKLFPKLHEMGSEGNYFSQEDIKDIIEYASDRGIRVVPEFDLPGHSTSWFIGYPELATVSGTYVLDTVFGVLDPVMDPTKEKVYNFLDIFIGEMAALFPDEYMHIGGDEVNPKQWNENTDIQEYMIEKGFSDHHELQAHFNTRLQKILEKHGKKMIGWDEIMHPDLSEKDIVVQSWRNNISLWKSAANGNKAVLSTGYYLDHKQSAGFHYKVDPLVIPGAVTIDIDSTNWKSWKYEISYKDMVFEGDLYLFGEGEQMKGIMSFMESTSGFDQVIIEDESLLFEYESSFGNVKYDITLQGDSLKGGATVALFTLDVKGKRTGGSDMPSGKPLPKFEKIESLTPEQASNILGGEACMWTEMVDARTIESRIWPRAAVIAEKLWSPKELTQDIMDMYRRLIKLDDRLVELGMQHKASSDEIILEMVEEPYIDPLSTLVGVLQEDKLFNRMAIYEPELYTTTPLNRIVDAARPESYIGYQFNQDVELWLETKDKNAENRIIESLKTWSENYNDLSLAFKNVERVKEVAPHSKHLSKLSEFGLKVFSDPESLKDKQQEIDLLIENASKGYGGTILSVESGLRKIIFEIR